MFRFDSFSWGYTEKLVKAKNYLRELEDDLVKALAGMAVFFDPIFI